MPASYQIQPNFATHSLDMVPKYGMYYALSQSIKELKNTIRKRNLKTSSNLHTLKSEPCSDDCLDSKAETRGFNAQRPHTNYGPGYEVA